MNRSLPCCLSALVTLLGSLPAGVVVQDPAPAKGPDKEIAEKLVITTNTVKRHLKAIFEKLDVHTRSAATAKATGDNKFKVLPRD